MGRKELVLINLAPASSPCLLTGLFSLSFSHLPSRCAPSLQVELVLLASFTCCCLRIGGAGASGPAGWDGVKEAANNEKVRQFHKPGRTLLCIFLSSALRAFFSSSWCCRSALPLPTAR